MQEVKVNFGLSSRSVIHEEGVSLLKIGTVILDRAITEDRDTLMAATEKVQNLCIKDSANRAMPIKDNYYKAYETDKLQFILAEIIEVNHYRKDTAYIRCRYYDNGKYFTGIFQASTSLYPDNSENCKNQYLIGTCMRKKYVVAGKTAYNKRSHQSYTIEEKTEKLKTKMIIAEIIDMNK